MATVSMKRIIIDCKHPKRKIGKNQSTAEKNMKTLSAIYRGNRVIELYEDVKLPQNIDVLVVIPDDERQLHNQFQIAAEIAFHRLWDNQEDEVWNDYL